MRAERTGVATILQVAAFGAAFWSLLVQPEAPLVSFNGMQSPANGEPSHRMTAGEIEHLIGLHAHVARLAADNGFDGVELQGAHGYLIHQSLSRWGNGREDEWGEPLAFARAVVAAVRDVLGPDKVLGFRMAADDDRPPGDGGRTPAELAALAGELVAGGDIDFLALGMGSRAPAYTARTSRSYRHAPGGDLHLAAGMRRAIGAAIPVVGVGRILSPEQGEAALRRGDCDLVAMTRAQMTDPDVVAKFRSRRSHRIRPCVGANECGNAIVAGRGRICFHNPDIGREAAAAIVPAAEPRRVVVVGAGPAGLKAAELAARRGHDVVVVDERDEPGGTLRHVRATAARELYETVTWLVGELDAAGAELRLGQRLDPAALRALAPDSVVLATGARRVPARAFPGAEGGMVLSSAEALAGEVSGEVVVLDRLGDMEACLVAERLIERGALVTYVTPLDSLAPRAGFMQLLDLEPILRDGGCDVLTGTDAERLAGDRLRLAGRAGGERRVDAVIAVTAPEPELALVPAVAELNIPYEIVGDALAPLGASAAIRQGDAAGRSI